MTNLTAQVYLDQNSSLEDVQIAFLNNSDLYALIDEKRFLDEAYSKEELLQIIQDWVLAGDECANW